LIKKVICLFALLSSCKVRSFGPLQSPSQQNSNSEIKIGFYAIDGTLDTCSKPDKANLTLICQLSIASRNKVTSYFEGVKDLVIGSDMGRIEDAVFKKICSDLEAGLINRTLIVGFSRGAISALILAERVNSDCSIKNSVPWIGLLDPVETSVWAHGRLPRDRLTERSIPNGVVAHFIHKEPIKDNNINGELFKTTTLRVVAKTNADLIETKIFKTNHNDLGKGLVQGKKFIGEESEVYRILKEAAESYGAKFVPLSSL
jgi:hypothetical protein